MAVRSKYRCGQSLHALTVVVISGDLRDVADSTSLLLDEGAADLHNFASFGTPFSTLGVRLLD